MNKICVLVLMAVVVAANVTAGERVLEAEINVAASVSEVWTAWTRGCSEFCVSVIPA